MTSVKGSVEPVILAGRAPAGPNEAVLGTDTQGRAAALGALTIGAPLGLIGGCALWRVIAEETNVVVAVDVVGADRDDRSRRVLGTSIVLAAWPAWTARRRNTAFDLRAE